MDRRHVMPTAGGLAALLIVLCLAPEAPAGTVTFNDAEFADADWDVTIFWTQGTGGNVSAHHVASGGHPGAYRVVINTVYDAPPYCEVAAFHRRLGAVYAPAAQGAIATIDYAEDATLIAGGGQGQGAGPAVRQDGLVYVAAIFITPDWVWTEHVLPDLAEDDFHLHADPSAHPDFSANGGPIEFGFVRQNATYSGGYTITGGIDNWTVVLTTEGPVAVEAASWTAVKALFD